MTYVECRICGHRFYPKNNDPLWPYETEALGRHLAKNHFAQISDFFKSR